MGSTVRTGDAVSVHYWGTLEDGTQFDSSEGKEPLSFTVGAGEMIAGFDAGVVGMKVGETKKIRIPAAQAYGERDDSLVVSVPAASLKSAGIPLKKGATFSLRGAPATILSVSGETVRVDTNHPLAGKTLLFKIKLVSID